MAVGGSVIIYGGLTYYNTLIKSFNQEIARDDSDTDALAFKFNISAVVFVHGLAAARMGTLPTTGDGDAGNNFAQIRYLFSDRQHFEYRVGVTTDNAGNITSPGALLMYADPANIQGNTDVSLRDVNNGPKARVMNITHISADNLFRVEVEFEIWQVQCNSGGTCGNTSGVLNNRWSVVDDIDRNFMTTRTFSGKLRCSSSQVNANNFRNLVVPPLQLGMRREHMSFTVSEDGLNLLYNILDKEVAFAPPFPATTWSARFAERREYEGQLGFFVDAEITLGGDRFVDKQKLIQIAASMAESKFQNGAAGFAADQSFYVQSIAVIDEYSDDASVVHVRATARRLDSTTPGLWGLTTTRLGKPIDLSDIISAVNFYDSRYSRDGGGEYGGLEVNGPIPMVGAFAAYLQGPCQINYAIANGIPAQQPPAPAVGGLPTISATVTTSIPNDESISGTYSTSNQQGMYEFWIIESHDETESNRVQMPVAATGSGIGSSGSSIGDAWWNGTEPQSPSTPNTAIVDLAPPSVKKRVIMAGERVGKPPDAIMPKDYTDGNGQTWKVEKIRKSVAGPKPTSDGKKIFGINYDYFYYAIGGGPITNAIGTILFNPWSVRPQILTPPPILTDPK